VIRPISFGGAARVGLLAVLLAALGCGGGPADVSGKVSYQGKTLVFGTVVMQGPDGLAIPGTINPDGTYRVVGVAPGKVLIGVVSRDPGPPSAAKGRVSGKTSREGEEAGPGAERSKWFPIPPKYEDHTKSGLTTTLKPGPNQYDIDLQP
jgi:hypothetical protein